MTIIGIVKRMSEPRTFEGNEGTITALEIELQSGGNVFVADAFDKNANDVKTLGIQQGDMVMAELIFSRASFQTKDGRTAYRQRVSVTAIHKPQPLTF